MITTNIEELAAAFTEWERQYREDPEEFMSRQDTANQSTKTYGEACAPYFVKLLREIQNRPHQPLLSGRAVNNLEAVKLAEEKFGPATRFGNGNVYEFSRFEGPLMLVWDNEASVTNFGRPFQFMRTC